MTPEQAFWKIHEDLSRIAPGSDQTTSWLLGLADPASSCKMAIDMGCGGGRSSLVLARHGLHVRAIDIHEPLLERLRMAAIEESLAGQLDIHNQSMTELTDLADKSFDLVWAEGSAYLIGWEHALQNWRRLLKSRGRLVATNLYWTTDTPSSDAVEFFAADNVTKLETAIEQARACGYEPLGTYVQPDSDWDEYYGPMSARLSTLAAGDDTGLQEAIKRTWREINLRRDHASDYAYIGIVLGLTA
jgi:SAM-dependent methyltransferase